MYVYPVQNGTLSKLHRFNFNIPPFWPGVLNLHKAYNMKINLCESRNTSKTAWKIILKGSARKRTVSTILIRENNDVINNPKDLGNTFEIMYSTVICNVADSKRFSSNEIAK